MPRDSRFPHICRAVPLSSSVFPAASALSAPSGHLPLEGKALSVVILFPHMRVFALMLWRKRYSAYRSLPHWGRGTAPAVLGCFRKLPALDDLPRSFSSRQCPIRPYGTPSPREEGFVRRYSFFTYACIRFDVMGEAVFSYRSLPH